MTSTTDIPESGRLSRPEFVGMIAMLFATVAFSIDSMLPALPEIAAELSPADPNRAQLILTSFVLGMGIGTFVAGPLSDRFGRKRVIMGGAVLYCLAALCAWAAPTLELLLIARVVGGLGASAPRVVSLALVRDLYRGREMARIMSFAMLIFTLVPAVAPLMGTVIIDALGWRGIFLSFLAFSAVSILWLSIRQPETLPPHARRPVSVAGLGSAFREVLSHRVILTAIGVQTLVFGALFGTLSSTQQVFDVTWGRGESFPLWFAVIALMAGTASLVNAALVMRLGMRFLVTVALGVQFLLSLGMWGMTANDLWPAALAFPAYVLWTTGVFFMAGLTLGNLNAMAMEPVGHIAGMAASVIGSIATVLAVALAAPLGLAFDGTPLPLMLGVASFAGVGFLLIRSLPRT
ncbi:multidrug effflux MFS transporter [Cereibacter azotoformans]|uniref:DHA1 family bicyclomycin/chloramphenicol resistance-like MFS transporter n=2 Tax=Cereibacter TaxID=1653176 RepID=A0A2T5KD05_9RHOB|nr:multidrug effflux MFS transporter [Cereibacter azotoformans]AXQ93530.1 MFS transporter [Cereibacter sphaeroides]MBO4168705.1 multidrug effflux MFS transporter [Cereibacter azotoformans]PTR20303.1 DHA1 family bicyclomycin/chloramphenicol resistance-like MFS transporter [Cereibacter azotoformans]UIJ31866.1 multidrug effflux MFS transporter [Cereibacter azotoformans]ULB09695.1 multidrug effflux MFS transporter [Cereibacter azotoformans]